MAQLRLLLVDDSPAFLSATVRLLAKHASVASITCVLSGPAALECLTQLRPDLVLLDFTMEGMNGLATTRAIKARPDAPYVVMVTLHDNSTYRDAAHTAGADGFLAKSELAIQLPSLITTLTQQ